MSFVRIKQELPFYSPSVPHHDVCKIKPLKSKINLKNLIAETSTFNKFNKSEPKLHFIIFEFHAF